MDLKHTVASPLFAVLMFIAPSLSGQQAKPLDDLTAFFIHAKLSGGTVDFNALADRTQRVMQAKGFGKVAIRALQATQLKSKYEAADPEALYLLSLQTLLTYEMNDGRFSVQTFEPGRVLALDPFGPRMPHPMPPNLAGQFALRMGFSNAPNARYVPLEPERARVIDPVARTGATGAIAEVTLRFTGTDPQQRFLNAQIESVTYRYAQVQGLVRMANPRLWPLTGEFPVAAGDPPPAPSVAAATAASGSEAAAGMPSAVPDVSAASDASDAPAQEAGGTAKPLDSLTLFFAYHKLSGEPVDFEAIARNTSAVHRASPFDREKVAAEKVAELRELYEAADTTATYVVALRTTMRYEMSQGRFDVDTFGPDRFMTYPSPFMPTALRAGAGFRGNHGFMDQTLAYRYGRRLSFANAENARYIPLPEVQARILGAIADAVVEVRFRLADSVDNAEEQFKTVRAQITSVSYRPAIGKPPANWPLKDPIPVAAIDLQADSASAATASADPGNRLDNWSVYFLYAKVAGEPIDFEGIAQASDNVRRAPQFDKADVLAREIARLREQYDAIDPKATFSLRVASNLHYEMDNERFRADLFDPGKFVNFNPMASGTRDFALSHRRIAFANAEALRYIPVRKEEAGKIDQVRRMGNTGAGVELELTVAGIGDPTGAVDSGGTLRMAVRSATFSGSRLGPGDIWPIDSAIVPPAWSARMDPPTVAWDKFDTMGLKTGMKIDDFRRRLEKDHGKAVNINPSRNEDPRLRSGVGFNPDGCFSFGNKVPANGSVCIRAYADERGIIRKIVVEQILEGADWEPTRVALLGKYGAMAESVRKANVQHYGWGPEVTPTVTSGDRLAPSRALSASLSAVQSAMDRMAASTRVSTNLRIRLIDPKWAGGPPAPEDKQTEAEKSAPPRTPRL